MDTTKKEGAETQAQEADGNASQTGQEQGDTEDPTAFILSRTRSEVHLLLDNISANPEVTIASLSARMPPPADLPPDWIHQICEITWPPKSPKADLDELAKQAALLIKARDYLNGLAKPASGATIAFTLMVTQEENPRARRRRATTSAPSSPSRSSLAGDAYPDLVDRARNFHVMMSSIVLFAVIALGITLLISWYLAVGNAALADFGTARASLTAAEGQVGEAQTAFLSGRGQTQGERPGGQTQGERPGGQTQGEQRESQTQGALPAVYFRNPCRDIPAQARDASAPQEPAELEQRNSYPSAQLRDACVSYTEQLRSYGAIRGGLSNWALGAGPEAAAWLANLLGTAVLPVLYGFLGAIASVVRTWSRKIKASLLSPRDVQLSFQQLALGALVGACISLFIAAPVAGDADTSLLGPVALSSSAISFVAGFGVDSVFQALEALISRIFNIAPAGSVARQEGRPLT